MYFDDDQQLQETFKVCIDNQTYDIFLTNLKIFINKDRKITNISEIFFDYFNKLTIPD